MCWDGDDTKLPTPGLPATRGVVQTVPGLRSSAGPVTRSPIGDAVLIFVVDTHAAQAGRKLPPLPVLHGLDR